MKKRFTFLLAALLLSGLTWAQTAINWIASEQGYTNAQVIESVSFDNNVSGTFNKGTNSNAPKYYDTGAAIRCYGGNYFTITSDYDLTQISLGFASGGGTNAITTNTGTYENGIWTGNATEVTFTIGGSSGHRRIASFEITYSTGGTPICATPTFSPAGGTYTEAQNVEIYCNTEGATIYYTLDGSDPTTSSLDYSSAIAIEETTTIKAIAVADNHNNSNVATATYTIISFDHEGTEADPYSVADAHTAIDANIGTQGVYATGIVSAIPTAFNSQYNNITFNMVDEAGDEVFLQAYRCTGDEAPNVAVGDIAVVSGNLTKYGSTYEFGSGCQLVSLEHPTVIVAAPTFSPVGGTYIEAQTVEISTATEGADIYYTLDGSDPDMDSEMYDTPIVVSTTTTIKAVAVDGDDNFSSVSSATYTIVPESNVSNITEVGTAYNVRGTVVATNSRGFIMGDGTGYVYYYKNGAPTQSVGDMVRVYGTTGTYGQIIQFTNTATVTEATASNYNGTPEAMVITEVPDYTEGYHLSDYLEFEGALAKDGNNYLITLGEAQIQVSYPTTDQSTALTALNGKNVHVKGYFSGINSSSRFTVMLESVEEVLIPAISVSPTSIEVPVEGANGSFTLAVTAVEFSTVEIFWCDADSTAAEYGLDWISTTLTESSIDYEITANQEPYERVAYFMVKGYDADNNEILSEFVTITQAYVEAPQPGITVTPSTVNLPNAEEVLGSLGVSVINFQLSDITDAWFDFYEPDENGGFIEIEEEENEPQWIAVSINSSYETITYLVEANEDEARTAYFKLAFSLGGPQVFSNMITISQPSYVAPVLSNNFELFTGDLVEGDYLIVYDNAAMKNTVDNSRLQFEAVTPENDVISTDNAAIIWHIAPSGDKWTIYSADANAYAASTGVKNKAQLLDDGADDKALWTVSETRSFEFVNKYNAENSVNANLRKNGTYGFACYATSTGGALSLYKRQEFTPTVASITVTPDLVELDADEHDGTLDLAYENLTITDMNDFGIQYYDAQGEETSAPAWIEVLVAEQDPEIGEGYVVSYNIYANQGEARSAYFKVFALDDELVYSNLVTVNQAAAQTQTMLYSYSINGFEGETIEAEGATITLQEGTDLNDDFTFAGWTTDANDVSQRLSGEYTLTEEVTVFYAVYAHTTTIGSTVTRDGASYVKVTSTADLEDGNYLIVYEEGGVAFDGSRDKTETPKLDDVNNTIDVSEYLNNSIIASNTTTDAAVFMIETIDGGYSIRSASGYYIGRSSNSNGLDTDETTALTNTISFDEDNNVDIAGSAGPKLRFNDASNQNRFRYYKSGQKAIQLYKYTGTPTPQPVTETNYYTRVFFTTEMVTSDIEIIGPSIVPSGNQLDMFSALGSYAIINDNPANLIIEGEVLSGEIQFNGTMLKNITACDYNENNSAGYYLIASPIDNFVPSIDNGFITDQYDLYAYNAAEELEWINFKDESNNFTSLQSNKGYLYANGVNTTLKFAGLLTGSYHTIIENLDYADGDNEAKRLTLIGNSSTYDLKCEVENSQYQSVTTNFLTLNESGDGFIVSESNYYNAEPMESFLVYAYEGGLRVLAYNSTLGYPWGGNVGGGPGPGIPGGGGPDGPFGCINPNSHLNITVSGTVSGQRGIALLDNAIVSFGEGATMKKLYLSENSTRVYIPQSNKDYAVVRSAAQGEMPVNFKASKNGSYTLAIDAENVEMNYLHLIDNMTGADVDLLATPSYTFDAKTTDYASRFKLVFSANANENDDENETFAFFNGSVWCISNTGEATLQVVDMLGRIVSSESVNGNATLSTDNLMSGVYMFRLVNGENVKVQKVVVK
jgi:hypothetical protein